MADALATFLPNSVSLGFEGRRNYWRSTIHCRLDLGLKQKLSSENVQERSCIQGNPIACGKNRLDTPKWTDLNPAIGKSMLRLPPASAVAQFVNSYDWQNSSCAETVISPLLSFPA